MKYAHIVHELTSAHLWIAIGSFYLATNIAVKSLIQNDAIVRPPKLGEGYCVKCTFLVVKESCILYGERNTSKVKSMPKMRKTITHSCRHHQRAERLYHLSRPGCMVFSPLELASILPPNHKTTLLHNKIEEIIVSFSVGKKNGTARCISEPFIIIAFSQPSHHSGHRHMQCISFFKPQSTCSAQK